MQSYWSTSTSTSTSTNASVDEGSAVGTVPSVPKSGKLGSRWMEYARQLGKQVARDMEAIPDVTEEMIEERVARGWSEVVVSQGRADKHRQDHIAEAKKVALNALQWQLVTRRRTQSVTLRSSQHVTTAARDARRSRGIPRTDPQNFNEDRWEATKVII